MTIVVACRQKTGKPEKNRKVDIKMKRIITTIVCGLASLALVNGATAQQQTVRVVIPFDFSASGAHLPPGTYTIATRNSFTSITKDGTGESAFVRAVPVTGNSDDSKLVFATDGDQRLLQKILCPRVNMSLELLPSKPQTRAQVQPVSNAGN
jgi:hypothetical protein